MLALFQFRFYTTSVNWSCDRDEMIMTMKPGKYCYILTVKYNLTYGKSVTSTTHGIATVKPFRSRHDIIKGLLEFCRATTIELGHPVVDGDAGSVLFFYLEPN